MYDELVEGNCSKKFPKKYKSDLAWKDICVENLYLVSLKIQEC